MSEFIGRGVIGFCGCFIAALSALEHAPSHIMGESSLAKMIPWTPFHWFLFVVSMLGFVIFTIAAWRFAFGKWGEEQ